MVKNRETAELAWAESCLETVSCSRSEGLVPDGACAPAGMGRQHGLYQLRATLVPNPPWLLLAGRGFRLGFYRQPSPNEEGGEKQSGKANIFALMLSNSVCFCFLSMEGSGRNVSQLQCITGFSAAKEIEQRGSEIRIRGVMPVRKRCLEQHLGKALLVFSCSRASVRSRC